MGSCFQEAAQPGNCNDHPQIVRLAEGLM